LVVVCKVAVLSLSVGLSLGVVGLGVVGIAVDKLDTDLLGEGQLNLLASGGGQLGDALLNRLSGVLNLRDGDALVLNLVLAADTGEEDGLVDAGLDWLGVGDGHINIDGGDNRDVVLGGLGNLVTVVVAISSVSVSAIGGGADSDHLDLGLLLEGDLNGLGGGGLLLLLVVVAADLVGDLLNGLSAHGAGDIIAELLVNNDLDGEVNVLADGLESWGADLGDLSHVLDSAVVLGLFVAITTIGGGVVAIGWGMVAIGGGVAVGRGGVAIGGSGVAGEGVSQGHESHDSSKSLKEISR